MKKSVRTQGNQFYSICNTKKTDFIKLRFPSENIDLNHVPKCDYWFSKV
jgi:hypothetical protein